MKKIDKDHAIMLYFKEGLSSTVIAERMNVDRSCISKLISKHKQDIGYKDASVILRLLHDEMYGSDFSEADAYYIRLDPFGGGNKVKLSELRLAMKKGEI